MLYEIAELGVLRINMENGFTQLRNELPHRRCDLYFERMHVVTVNS